MIRRGARLFGKGAAGAIGDMLAKVVVLTLSGLSFTYFPAPRDTSTDITARRIA